MMMIMTRSAMLLRTLLTLSASWNTVLSSSPSSPSSIDPPIIDPLLLRAARGEAVERTPVWMMRQAGRHMKAYRDLVPQYPTFRERSETPEVSLRISLQPLEACKYCSLLLTVIYIHTSMCPYSIPYPLVHCIAS
jgi:hypothetical protein